MVTLGVGSKGQFQGHIPRRMVVRMALLMQFRPSSPSCGPESYRACLGFWGDRWAVPGRNGASLLGRGCSWLGIFRLKLKEEDLERGACSSRSLGLVQTR